jgi:hypothetical protein
MKRVTATTTTIGRPRTERKEEMAIPLLCFVDGERECGMGKARKLEGGGREGSARRPWAVGCPCGLLCLSARCSCRSGRFVSV